MELITLILSGVLAVFSSGGWVVNAIAHKQLNTYIESAEELAIRIDNTPNYQIAQGDLERLRVAGRGVYLEPNLRIDSLELETDPIALDLAESTESLSELRDSLEKPLQGAVSVVITEQDLTNALQSEDLQAKLQSALNKLVASRAGTTSIAYEIIALGIDLTPNNLLIEITLRREGEIRANQASELAIALNLGLELIQGKKIQIGKLEGTVNNRPISNRLLNGFAEGISDRLDLTTIEQQGIFARLLQLEIKDDKIVTVGFVRMETKSVSTSSIIDEGVIPSMKVTKPLFSLL